MSQHTPHMRLPWEKSPLDKIADYAIISPSSDGFVGTFPSEQDRDFVLCAANLHDALVSNLVFEHREAAGEQHFSDVAAKKIGCSVCVLLDKAEARP